MNILAMLWLLTSLAISLAAFSSSASSSVGFSIISAIFLATVFVISVCLLVSNGCLLNTTHTSLDSYCHILFWIFLLSIIVAAACVIVLTRIMKSRSAAKQSTTCTLTSRISDMENNFGHYTAQVLHEGPPPGCVSNLRSDDVTGFRQTAN